MTSGLWNSLPKFFYLLSLHLSQHLLQAQGSQLPLPTMCLRAKSIVDRQVEGHLELPATSAPFPLTVPVWSLQAARASANYIILIGLFVCFVLIFKMETILTERHHVKTTLCWGLTDQVRSTPATKRTMLHKMAAAGHQYHWAPEVCWTRWMDVSAESTF